MSALYPDSCLTKDLSIKTGIIAKGSSSVAFTHVSSIKQGNQTHLMDLCPQKGRIVAFHTLNARPGIGLGLPPLTLGSVSAVHADSTEPHSSPFPTHRIRLDISIFRIFGVLLGQQQHGASVVEYRWLSPSPILPLSRLW